MSDTETLEKTDAGEAKEDIKSEVIDDPYDIVEPTEAELNGVDEKAESPDDEKLDTGMTEEDAEKVVSKKEENKPDVEDAGVVDDALVNIAVEFGMEEKEARSFDSARDLEKHLMVLSERDEKDAGKSKDGEKKTETKTDATEKFKIELGEGEFDEEMVEKVNEAIAKVVDRYEGNNQKLQQEIDSLKGTLQKNQTALFINNFDTFIESHAKAYEKELGSGPMSELGNDSAEIKNRVAVIEEMDALVAGYTLREKPIPPDKELVRRAMNNIFGDRAANTARKELSDKITRRNRSSVARPNTPTNRKAPTGKNTTTKDAVAAVGALMKEKGLSTDTVDESFE